MSNESQFRADHYKAGLAMGRCDKSENKVPIYTLVQDRLVCVEYDFTRPVNQVSEQLMARGYIKGYKEP